MRKSFSVFKAFIDIIINFFNFIPKLIYKINFSFISFDNSFDVITAIQSHHYFQKQERKKAVENVYRALKEDGIYISFENVVPDDENINLDLKEYNGYCYDICPEGTIISRENLIISIEKVLKRQFLIL